MPSGGGEARTLLTDTSIGMFLGDLAWTPDGQQLLFVKRAHFNEEELDPRQSIELWRISSEGGEPQRAGLASVGLNHFQLHPDGRRIAFTVATGGSEVWVMENFLAGLSASR